MPTQAARGLRALLLDDDEHALAALEALLGARYPELRIEARTAPDPTGEHDLYFIDDDFEGVRLAGKLARRIRARRPEAVIVAFAAALDERTLRELVAAGCNGACDKGVPADLPEMLEAVDRCLSVLRAGREPERSGPPMVSAFRELFREWNRRLASQE
jgi:DNA-binding NarL/FixJ family response regulator